jgi:hypothetical protein
MKFSKAPVEPPRLAPATVTTVAGVEVGCLVRHLMADQEAGILADARAFAKARGVEDPRHDDPLYMLGLMVSTVQRGYVDADAPAEGFFDGGAAQILQLLDQDRIAYLWARHGAFQDACAGRNVALTDGEVLARVSALAAADATDPGPVADLRPLQQRHLMRAMARLILTLTALLQAPPAAAAQAPAS